MLVEFQVGNYLSFKEIAKFSMVAAAIKEESKDGNIFAVSSKLNLLTGAVVYGANASGKSNLLKALAFMKKFVLNSSKESQATEPIPVVPFRLSTSTLDEPSLFEVTFIHESVRYRYGFAVDAKQVRQEWLFYAPKGIEARLFIRDQGKIELGSYFKEGKGLEDKTRPNALFLSVTAQFNGEISNQVLRWFSGLQIFTNDIDGLPLILKTLSDPEYRRKIIHFFNLTGLNLHDLHLENHPNGSFWLRTVYQSSGEPGVSLDLDYNDESTGTKKLITISACLLTTIAAGNIILIDDFDSHLHPLVLRFILTLFYSQHTNPKNAQFLTTTRDISLLSREYFRRDQIWFTEKNDNGASKLYSLVEYKLESGVKVRNDATYSKEYLLGSYGAIPNIRDLPI